jgi:hypothetical protein
MGNWEFQTLPPTLDQRVAVRAEVVNGDDEVIIDGTDDHGQPFRVKLTSNHARALGEALYLAGATASWARFRRETERG